MNNQNCFRGGTSGKGPAGPKLLQNLPKHQRQIRKARELGMGYGIGRTQQNSMLADDVYRNWACSPVGLEIRGAYETACAIDATIQCPALAGGYCAWVWAGYADSRPEFPIGTGSTAPDAWVDLMGKLGAV